MMMEFFTKVLVRTSSLLEALYTTSMTRDFLVQTIRQENSAKSDEIIEGNTKLAGSEIECMPSIARGALKIRKTAGNDAYLRIPKRSCHSLGA